MRGSAQCVFLVLFGLAEGATVTPIQKVLQMMEAMKEKGIAEKKAEAVRFSEFSQWCQDISKEKEAVIEKNSNLIQKLAADIELAEADIESATARIAELEEDIGRWKKDEQAATEIREKEKLDYMAVHTDYVDTVDACERAIEVIRSMPDKLPNADLLQQEAAGLKRSMKAAKGPEAAASVRKASKALLEEVRSAGGSKDKQAQMPNEMLFREAPKSYGYSTSSTPIMEMIKELKTRFIDEQTALEKEEIGAQTNFEQLLQRLNDQTELAEKEVDHEEKFKATRMSDKADMEGEKAQAEQMLAKAQEYLAGLKALCAQKSTDFESRQKLRAQEIDAISQAIDIISSDDVKTEYMPTLIQKARSLLQLPASADTSKKVAKVLPEQVRAAELLRDRAAALDSKELSLMAKRAMVDPFAKVKKMISNLLVKLMEEANAEAEHHGWCSTELATNEQTRNNKAEAVDDLAAEVERLEAKEVTLTQEISDLTDDIKALEDAMTKATSERMDEKAKNEQTIEDAKMSQTAVANALAVLRDFYAKAGEATALVQKQTPAEDAPATFDAPYKGLQAESGGVIGMLEVVESDFARLGVETDAAETEAAAAYKQFMADSDQEKAVAQTTVEHKTEKLAVTKQLHASTKRSLQQTQDELDAALAYYDKLKPTCVDSGISWKDRIYRRNQEIESLKDAYKILSGESVPSFQDMKAEQVGTDGGLTGRF